MAKLEGKHQIISNYQHELLELIHSDYNNRLASSTNRSFHLQTITRVDCPYWTDISTIFNLQNWNRRLYPLIGGHRTPLHPRLRHPHIYSCRRRNARWVGRFLPGTNVPYQIVGPSHFWESLDYTVRGPFLPIEPSTRLEYARLDPPLTPQFQISPWNSPRSLTNNLPIIAPRIIRTANISPITKRRSIL